MKPAKPHVMAFRVTTAERNWFKALSATHNMGVQEYFEYLLRETQKTESPWSPEVAVPVPKAAAPLAQRFARLLARLHGKQVALLEMHIQAFEEQADAKLAGEPNNDRG